MASPMLELTGAVVSRLKAQIEVPVYDDVPPAAAFPYVSLGPIDEINVDADCITASDVSMQIDIWSRSGRPDCLRIAEQVKRALDDYEASLSINALVLMEHRNTRCFRDPDGLTYHAAVEIAAVIETSS